MTAIVPITHDEEQLARQAGDILVRAGHSLLRMGTEPALAEALTISALLGGKMPPAGFSRQAEVDQMRHLFRNRPMPDPALAVPSFLAEFWPVLGFMSGTLRLPSELVWLMDALAAGSGGWVYCPYSLSLQSAVLATRRYGSVVFHDAPLQAPLIETLLSLCPGLDAWGHNPLGEGAPVPASPPDCVISAAILTKRIAPGQALYTMDPDGHTTGNSDLIRLDRLVAGRSKRIVSLVSWGVLSGTRRLERLFKTSLLGAGMVEAVVQLPFNLIAGTRWNPALLVLDAGRDKAAPVRLVDASEGLHVGIKGRYTESRLKGWREVADCFGDDRSDRVRLMDSQALVQAGCDITPRRHVQEGANALAGLKTRPLGQLVRSIRGQIWPGTKRLAPGETTPAEHVFFEAAIKNIGADGLLRRPEKGLAYSGVLSPAQSNQLLRPGDILLSCKGSVGKVALVPEDCGPNWIPSQSFHVLRPLPGTDPICLFHQLRSPALQEIIAHLVTGGTVPQIKTADMGNLPIRVLGAGEAERIKQAHKEVLKISAEIARLKQKRAKLLMEIIAETKQ